MPHPTPEQQELLRKLPQVDELLQHPAIQSVAEAVPHDALVQTVREAIDDVRQRILAGRYTGNCEDGQADMAPDETRAELHESFDPEALLLGTIAQQAQLRVLALQRPSLRGSVNASGVIIHTNLGRSVLAPSAVDAVMQVAQGYSTLEYDTDAMARGSRHAHVEQLICALTGAEGAIAVNNNAAAVMMVLAEFAAGHEALVSRGELVEIGGSFRIPDIMAQAHAAMVEVGTTNKTHVNDYQNGITEDTALLLKVHTSNYRVIGFTESVSVKDLRKLADEENARRAKRDSPLPCLVYEDQGSGSLLDLDVFGEYAEPTVAASLSQGADLVSYSGDKLLGGPQAGIIVGRREFIDRLKASPLARALRLDKMTLAALEATLRLYLDPERALQEIPTLAMLTRPASELKTTADTLAEKIAIALPEGAANVTVVEEISRAGGGALPMCDIPTYCVQVEFLRGNAVECNRHLISERETPVIGRLKHDCLLLDVRTLASEADQDEIVTALMEYRNYDRGTVPLS